MGRLPTCVILEANVLFTCYLSRGAPYAVRRVDLSPSEAAAPLAVHSFKYRRFSKHYALSG